MQDTLYAVLATLARLDRRRTTFATVCLIPPLPRLRVPVNNVAVLADLGDVVTSK